MDGLCSDLWRPHCRQCTMWARMCTSAAPTKELLDLFNAEKQPSTRIYHVTMKGKTHVLVDFLWLISRRGFFKKTKKTKNKTVL